MSMSDWGNLFDLASGKQISNDIGDQNKNQANKKAPNQRKIESPVPAGQEKDKDTDTDTDTEKKASIKKKAPLISNRRDSRMILPKIDCTWGSTTNHKFMKQGRKFKITCKCKYCDLTSPNSVLSHIELGASLKYNHIDKDKSRFCHQWTDTSEIDDEPSKTCHKETKSLKLPNKVRLCQNCHQSPLWHEIKSIQKNPQSSFSTKTTTSKKKTSSVHCNLIHLFFNIRNIRSSISCLYSSSHLKMDLEHARKLILRVSEFLDRCAYSCNSILQTLLNHNISLTSKGEIYLLIKKADNLMETTNSFKTLIIKNQSQQLKQNKNLRQKEKRNLFLTYPIFQCKIRILVAVDALYFRLYYLTLNGFFSSTFSTELQFPSPCIYFGTPGLSWDVPTGEKAWNKLAVSIVNDFRTITKQDQTTDMNQQKLQEWIRDRFGMPIFLDSSPPNHKEKTLFSEDDKDPLTFLHTNRFLETILLFWSQYKFQLCPLPHQEMLQALKDKIHILYNHDKKVKSEKRLLPHETPAPSILCEWRDSCRDHFCTLYAYATVPPVVIKSVLPNIMNENKIDKIIEIGSGTGYIASLIKNVGINAIAYDVAPQNSFSNNQKLSLTQNWNAYHGTTPSFCAIKEGNSNNLRQLLLQNTKGDTKKLRSIALMLCYPPPSPSLMAFECLSTFIAMDGKMLIYIGEFNGLTASPEFETLLVKSFLCFKRIPCFSWGTDAAELTIWIRKSSLGNQVSSCNTASILLPCCYCGIKPAISRCLRARTLVYCGKECFKFHQAIRKANFELQIIPHKWNEDITFDNDMDFVNLCLLNDNKSNHTKKTIVALSKRSNKRNLDHKAKKRKGI